MCSSDLGEQAIVAVKGIELAGFEPALQAILEKVRAALIEEHAAFLVNERLQELELRFRQLNLCGERSHGHVRCAQSNFIRNLADQALLRSAYEFRGLLESFELRSMQKLGDIQQDD